MTQETEKKNVTANKPTKTASKNHSTNQQKSRQLSMAKVKREAVKTSKMEDYELNSVDKIRHYPIFSQGKINEMLKEYQEQTQYATEQDVLLPEERALDYIYFLCIKHFTSLKKGISDKYEEQILQMNHLVDSGYYTQIVNEVFMQSEINKVLDSITDVISSFQLLESVNTQINQKTESLKIKNKNMLNVLANDSPYESVDKH